MAISAEELNIILQVRDQQFQKAMQANERRVARFSQKGGQSLDRFGRSYTNMGRSVGAQRAALQNASFQVQDIITQITMGTPALRALSVQLPQLLGGFGAAGAAIGVAVGALGLFTPSSNKAAEATKNLADELESAYGRASSALEAAREAQDRYSAAIQLSRAAQSEVTPAILSNLKLEAQAREALARLEVARMERAKAALEASIPVLQERVRLIGEEVRAEMDRGTMTGSAQERLQVERSILEETQKRLDAAYELTGELQEQQAELDLINSHLGLANDEASQFIDTLIGVTSNMSASADEAGRMADNLLAAASNAAAVAANKARAERMGLTGSASGPDAARSQLYDQGRLGGTRTGVVSRTSTGGVTSSRGGGGRRSGGGGGAASRDPLADLIKEVALNEELLGLSDARAQVMRRLGDDAEKYSEEEINGIVQRIQAYEAERAALEEIQEQQQGIADTIETEMTDAFMGIIDGTKTASEAFRDMARSIIAELTRVLVVQQMVGSFNSATGKGSGIVGAIMGAFSDRASGGSVMAGQAYRVGEHGPEPFIPAQNGRILSVAQAKSALGGNQNGPTVNQTINVTTGVQQTVRAEIKSLMPQITEAAVAATRADKMRRPA